MCQQTGVSTVIPYYERFLKKFPTLESLAASKESEVIKLWEGLGYYSRARNLRNGAKFIAQEFSGNLPKTREQIIKTPGIGEYSAGAILSIAYGLSEPALDGNYIRIYSRYFGIKEDVRSTKVLKQLWEIARSLVPEKTENVRAFTEGLMDLGAMVCKPKQAQCLICPINKGCFAFRQKKVEALPFKSKGRKREKFKEQVYLLKKQNRIAFLKKGEDSRYPHFLRLPYKSLSSKETPKRILGKLKYSITHRDYEVFITKPRHLANQVVWKTPQQAEKIALPAIDRKILKLYA